MSTSDLPPDADKEWNELLHQLRQHPRPEPQPFFYARVHARLLARAAPRTLLPAWLRRPAYAAALCALVLAVSGDGAAATTASAGHPVQRVAR